MTLDEAVGASLRAGISGFAVCNHNTPFYLESIPSHIEKKYNVKINPKTKCNNAFYIIPGIEIETEIGHQLKLFIDKESHASNEITVLAHPFEHSREYTSRAKLLSEKATDVNMLVEAYSGRANYKNKKACEMAKKFAHEHNFLLCAGSDAHFPFEIGNAWVEFNDDVYTLEDIKEALVGGKNTYYSKNCKRTIIAKSQIIKNGYKPKTVLFYFYSLIRDFGDLLCRRSHL